MSKQELPQRPVVPPRVCDVFKSWTGRERDHLSVNQLASATGLRASQLLGLLDSMVASGVLEAVAGSASMRRYRPNTRPTAQQLQQKMLIVEALRTGSPQRENDFAY